MAEQDNNDIQWNYYVGPSERTMRRGGKPLAPMHPTAGRNHHCRICTRSFDRPSSLVQVSEVTSDILFISATSCLQM